MTNLTTFLEFPMRPVVGRLLRLRVLRAFQLGHSPSYAKYMVLLHGTSRVTLINFGVS
jgi:hypothetical protein